MRVWAQVLRETAQRGLQQAENTGSRHQQHGQSPLKQQEAASQRQRPREPQRETAVVAVVCVALRKTAAAVAVTVGVDVCARASVRVCEGLDRGQRVCVRQ